MNNNKIIICEDKYGDTIFSFETTSDINISKYNNCEIADIELDENNNTIIRLQAID